MTHAPATGKAAPVAGTERVAALDVLRGIALSGVLLMNITGFAAAGVMATEAQLLALPTAAIDGVLEHLLGWLVAGKAYSIFAFLFGLGFYVQWQRAEARGGDFEAIYLRRLTVLLLFGIAHTVFVWSWDILHLYALAGFALFALRRVRDRTLLVAGIGLALATLPLYELAVGLTASEWLLDESNYTDAAVLARQAASEGGSYPALVRAMFGMSVVDWLLSGYILAWFGWSLGRFLLGAWVGRRGWLQDAAHHLPGFRRVLRVALPAGLIACGVGQLLVLHDGGLLPDWDHWYLAGSIVNQLGTPVLALGYVCAVVLALHAPQARRAFDWLADVGRMALTNYVAQSLLIGFVLFGIGPGLALAGRIGTAGLTAISLVAFAGQVAFSRWWLRRYRFGPLEWLWRAATYRQWPALRIAAAPGNP